MSARVAIVGGGAVGQVYGLHMLAAGAEVTYFVRERYVAELEAGVPLYRLPSRSPQALRPTHVQHDVEALADGYDQVWLCVPTNALTSGALDGALAAVARAPKTSLVCMLPGMQVRALLDQHLPREQVVDGLIGMIAYQAPLPGENVDPPGVAYVLPRLSPSKFSGATPTRVRAVSDLLRRGGCPAGVVADARVSLAFSSCLMMPMVVALEGAGWRMASLRKGDWLTLAAGAAREALTLVGAELGVPAPWFRPLLRRPLFSLISYGATWLAPFDAELYLRYHFTKVGEQTRLMLRGYLDSAAERRLPAAHIGELNQRVFGASQ